MITHEKGVFIEEDGSEVTINLLPREWSASVEHIINFNPDIRILVPFQDVKDIEGFQFPSGLPEVGTITAKVAATCPADMLEYTIDGQAWTQVPSTGLITITIDTAGEYILTVRMRYRISTNEYVDWQTSCPFVIYDLNGYAPVYELTMDTYIYNTTTELPEKQVRKLRILKQGYDGQVREVCGAGNSPVVVEWGDAGSDDVLAPIRSSRCGITLLRREFNEFSDLIDSGFMEYLVQVTTANNNVIWQGWLTNENFEHFDIEYPYVIKMTAVDGLSILRDKAVGYKLTNEFKRYNRVTSIADVIRHALRELRFQDQYYFVAMPWAVQDSWITNANPLEFITVDMNYLEVDNVYELLERVLGDSGLRISQFDRGWLVEFVEGNSDYDGEQFVVQVDIKTNVATLSDFPLTTYDIGLKGDPGDDNVVAIGNDTRISYSLPSNVELRQKWKIEKDIDLNIDFGDTGRITVNGGQAVQLFLTDRRKHPWAGGFVPPNGFGAPTFMDNGLAEMPVRLMRLNGNASNEYVYLEGRLDWDQGSQTNDPDPTSRDAAMSHPLKWPAPVYSEGVHRLRIRVEFQYYGIITSPSPAEQLRMWYSLIYNGMVYTENGWQDLLTAISSGDFTNMSNYFWLPNDDDKESIRIVTDALPYTSINDGQFQLRIWRPNYNSLEIEPIVITDFKVEMIVEEEINPQVYARKKLEGEEVIDFYLDPRVPFIYDKELEIVDPEEFTNAPNANVWRLSDGSRLPEVVNRINGIALPMRSVLFEQAKAWYSVKQKRLELSFMAGRLRFGQRAIYYGERYMAQSLSWNVAEAIYKASYVLERKAQLEDPRFTVVVSGRSLNIVFQFTGNNTITVEWGDGNADTYTGLNSITVDHTYAATATYTARFRFNITPVNIDATNAVNIVSVDNIPVSALQVLLQLNKLNSAAINAVLANVLANGGVSGTLRLDSQSTGAAPTGQGLADKLALQGNGWTVITD